MKKTTLLLKGRWRTALLVLALSVAGMGNLSAQPPIFSFDFSEVCPTGQQLWYKITDEANRYVEVVAPAIGTKITEPYGLQYETWQDFWVGYSKPIGDLVIPAQVRGYTVVGLSRIRVSSGLGGGGFASGSFEGCVGLVSVVIPNTVTSIGQYAFSGCTGLNSVDIPNSVTLIDGNAFSGCTGLTSIDIPNSVTLIGGFSGCTGLTSIDIPNSVTSIGNGAFSGCIGLTSVVIPNSVTSIGSNAFSGFNGTFITIPKSVASIGSGAFGNCARLTTVYYNAENAVASNVFCSYQNGNWINSCPNLTTIHIGADVQEIHPVFSGCSSVHLVVALGPTPAVLQSNALTDIAENSILMVSCGKRMTYFSVWNMFEFNNIMEDCNTYPVSMGNVGAGGSISASTTNAQMGEVVDLTVSPNAGMMLSSISVFNASDPTQTIPVMPVGKATSMYRFVMPPFGVSVTATFVAGTSVGENGSVPASVYPNPTNGQIKIEAESLKYITISNMLGQTIYEGKAYGDRFEYDFGKHGAGIYLVRIETGEGVATKRVVVTR